MLAPVAPLTVDPRRSRSRREECDGACEAACEGGVAVLRETRLLAVCDLGESGSTVGMEMWESASG